MQPNYIYIFVLKKDNDKGRISSLSDYLELKVEKDPTFPASVMCCLKSKVGSPQISENRSVRMVVVQ